MMGGLDNTQEVRLEAEDPLPDKPVQRSLPSLLGGNMMSYAWTINGARYPNRNSLNVKEGERVELVNRNETGMAHPMHLHGHVFEVTEIDGQKISGAKRDTILVPPKSTIKIVFEADNPGRVGLSLPYSLSSRSWHVYGSQIRRCRPGVLATR